MNIEIWSDIVCPFCYLGKRRFERALAAFEGRAQVEVVWRSFELDPDAQREYHDSLDHMLARKYGITLEQAREMNEQVTRAAAAEGLDYRLDRARRGNTFDAHRLTHLARDHGSAAEAHERLFHAYFNEGLPIGDRETLVDLAAEVGLERGLVRSTLASDAYAGLVRGDERRARELGIGGVPFFLLGGRYGVSGAQTVEVFGQALERAWSDQVAPAR